MKVYEIFNYSLTDVAAELAHSNKDRKPPHRNAQAEAARLIWELLAEHGVRPPFEKTVGQAFSIEGIGNYKIAKGEVSFDLATRDRIYSQLIRRFSELMTNIDENPHRLIPESDLFSHITSPKMPILDKSGDFMDPLEFKHKMLGALKELRLDQISRKDLVRAGAHTLNLGADVTATIYGVYPDVPTNHSHIQWHYPLSDIPKLLHFAEAHVAATEKAKADAITTRQVAEADARKGYLNQTEAASGLGTTESILNPLWNTARKVGRDVSEGVEFPVEWKGATFQFKNFLSPRGILHPLLAERELDALKSALPANSQMLNTEHYIDVISAESALGVMRHRLRDSNLVSLCEQQQPFPAGYEELQLCKGITSKDRESKIYVHRADLPLLSKYFHALPTQASLAQDFADQQTAARELNTTINNPKFNKAWGAIEKAASALRDGVDVEIGGHTFDIRTKKTGARDIPHIAKSDLDKLADLMESPDLGGDGPAGGKTDWAAMISAVSGKGARKR